jgi:hypothetical protein
MAGGGRRGEWEGGVVERRHDGPRAGPSGVRGRMGFEGERG